jgi:valyl-tRNA synthetase
MIPFVTEEIWDLLPNTEALLAESPWPASDLGPLDAVAERDIAAAIDVITGVRGWRDGLGVKAGAMIPARLSGYDDTQELIFRLARLERTEGEPAARYPYANGILDVFASPDVDLDVERQQAAKRLETLRGEVKRAEGKLSNERFVSKAPADVVQGERDKLDALKRELEELEAR